jgi:GT2 family glycosyltransferase
VQRYDPRSRRLESGSWGSRLWFDGKEHRLCVGYRAPVPLRLELRSERDASPQRVWELPAGDERQCFREELSTAGLDRDRPWHLALEIPDTRGERVELERLSLKPTSPPDWPEVAVGIVTYNRRTEVASLLRQLREIDYPHHAVHITVVDNASGDGTVSRIRDEHPDVQVLENPENLGGSGGFNRFFCQLLESERLPRFAWLIDDDARIDANTLKSLVRLLEDRPDAIAAGSVMMNLEGRDQAWEAGGQLFANRFGWNANLLQTSLHELRRDESRCREVGYAGAYSLLLRSEVLRTAGIWRNYFLHVDDSEWCYRARKSTGGKVLIAHDSLVWHVLQGVRKPFTLLRAYETRNFLHYFASHASPREVDRVLRECLGMALRQLLVKRRDLCDFHLQGVESFFDGRYGRLDLERRALRVENVDQIVAEYRRRHRAEPRRAIVVSELNDYAKDGHDHEEEITRRLRAALPSAEILCYGHRDLAGAGADGRIEPLPASRLKTLFQQLRGICWPRPGVVVLPFWNQSVAVNHLARLVAVYEDGGFSIYELPRKQLISALLRLGLRSLVWSWRARRGRYATEPAAVPITVAQARLPEPST